VSFLRSRLDPAIDVDDVVQEVFVRAWSELPRFRGDSRFRTWLYAIALASCADAGRRFRRAQRAVAVTEPLTQPLETEGDWPAAMVLREELQQALRALPDAERETLELYYYADLNLPEIARLLDVNLSTLKYRFYQAHRRLRAQLDPQEGRHPEGGAAAPGADELRLAQGRSRS